MTIHEPDDSAPCTCIFFLENQSCVLQSSFSGCPSAPFLSFFFSPSPLSLSRRQIFGKGEAPHKIIIRHPTTPRAGKGKKKHQTKKGHKGYIHYYIGWSFCVFFFSFFCFAFFFSPSPTFCCHVEESTSFPRPNQLEFSSNKQASHTPSHHQNHEGTKPLDHRLFLAYIEFPCVFSSLSRSCGY